ncbi:uncharacterized protein K02A2.6-like [Panicum virgatum]|uniref:uncharacterized protein K02A2.6-like n=1 Tax=Panicum virgatum TaxID=38727 RepID=UPI0019D5D737|nr:uncharacterized protein K02A2.6-like [Panicum virgatum]
MVGPLSKAPGGFTHLLVAVDKFTKWIEAKPNTSLKLEQAVSFFQDIVHRFGVPNLIIMDNGTNFTGGPFLEFCDDHNTRVDWAAVAHPCTNGQVERANGMVLQGLKPRIYNRLKKFVGRWVAELPSVLWSLRTTPSRATGFTPFFMVYGSEAILPTDMEYGSPRVKAYDPRESDAAMEDALDQQALHRYHQRHVRGRAFNIGDLVLRRVQSMKGRHKLSPPWEGPYIVAEVLRPGTYKLQTADGEVFTNAWNIEQLCHFLSLVFICCTNLSCSCEIKLF